MIYIGVDPGKTGAIAVLGDTVTGPYVVDLVDGRIALPFRRPGVGGDKVRVFVELPDARPGKGVRDFLIGAGRLAGYLECFFGVEATLVLSTLWSPALGCVAGDRGIAQRREMAVALWPLLAPVLMRHKDKDRVSALLIAEYGRRRGGL